MLRDNRLHANLWCFIGGPRKNNESFEETILREIENETSLRLFSVKLLGTLHYNSGDEYMFHATLTTDNLNNIKREESKNLDFFSLQEIEKLPLTKATKVFLSSQRNTIKKILYN